MGPLLSSDEVLEAIKQFSRTPSGKAAIQEHTHRKRGEFVPKWWDKRMVFRTIKQMYRAAEDMADILYKHIIQDTDPGPEAYGTDRHGEPYKLVGLTEFNRSDIIVHHPMKVGGPSDDQYRCNISIRSDALKRKSLVPGHQLNDIIELFVHGYSSANNHAYGEWHGHDIIAPVHKEGNNFVQNAVDEFNAKYKGKAVATVKDEYMRWDGD